VLKQEETRTSDRKKIGTRIAQVAKPMKREGIRELAVVKESTQDQGAKLVVKGLRLQQSNARRQSRIFYTIRQVKESLRSLILKTALKSQMK
jgi:hypothetical protein